MLKQSLAASLIVTGLVASPMLSSRVAAQALQSPQRPQPRPRQPPCTSKDVSSPSRRSRRRCRFGGSGGVPQTWVLTSVKVIAGQLKDTDVAKQVYLLNKVDQTQAQAFYGKRVGVVGHVGAGATHPTLEVISMREISGGCPVLPNLPQ